MNGEARKNVTCALLCRAFNRNIHGLPFRLLFMTILPSSLPLWMLSFGAAIPLGMVLSGFSQ